MLEGERVVVLLSGGRDSVCLLSIARERARDVTALHVNYGLRAGADGDEAFCRELCADLGVSLSVVRAGAPVGNVQAWARDVRYRAAHELPGLIAVGHTASDQVEGVLYRLAASPGRRALLGMREREGRVVRPLLEMTREETAAHNRERGLSWREDPTNDDPVYARNRARADLVPALKTLHPAAEANVLRTLSLLRAEAEVLDTLLDAPFAELPLALQRLQLDALAANVRPDARSDERKDVRSVARHAEAVARLARRGGSATLDLGGGLRAIVEYGDVRVEPARAPVPPPDPIPFSVPCSLSWGGATFSAEQGAGDLDAAALGDALLVRPWQPGDRVGSRSLQDLFTNAKVPRARRAHVPVVVARGEVAWVAGLATGARFRATADTRDRVRLCWS